MRKLLLIIPALAVALTACYPVSTLPADFPVATAESSENAKPSSSNQYGNRTGARREQ